ncbi:hypothetical protein JQS43_12490 [Natronosporangium hydrolyticum]|uniref:MFS transporter n=1 Tax=Natronosporangium hydrolyticum TaxID=2811111 RepID=A0A895YGR2_9ACTN|nr:MFS transporter [Natronosporangium hydrolyticum]QSB17007.1 hypothetical protein JQS43_12490 [Natronosporangium hydrolyticum]
MRRLLLANLISGSATLAVFTALAAYVQQTVGATATTALFLVQTVAVIALARWILRLLPSERAGLLWGLGQVVQLLLCVLLLPVREDLALIVVYAGVVAGLGGVSAPLMLYLVGRLAEEPLRQGALTGLASGRTASLAIGPGIAAVLIPVGGVATVILVAALLYAACAALVAHTRHARLTSAGGDTQAPARGFLSTFARPDGVGRGLVPMVILWAVLALAGGAVNAVEFPVMDVLHGFSASMIGVTLAAYGVGGLVVFVLNTLNVDILHPLVPFVVLPFALLGWAFLGPAGALIGFFLTGATYSLVSGWIRYVIDREATRSGVVIVDLWAWLQQIAAGISVVVYLLFLAAFALAVSLTLLVFLMVGLFGVLGWFGVVAWRSERRAGRGSVQEPSACTDRS